MNIKDLLKETVEKGASDLFCHAGGLPYLRIDGKIMAFGKTILKANDLERMVDDITMPEQKETYKNNKDVDFAIYIEELKRRFRVNMFVQNGSPSLVIRNVPSYVPTFEELNLPAEILKKLSLERRGLVLLTGSTGSGKSTTIASMIEYINNNAGRHIVTIEEPVEFAFKDKNCIINQREIGSDVVSYTAALRAFALQSPDVIFISNIRDYETMSTAITAAETGVLVLSTLHTINASQTVERIINFFPPHQHQQTRTQLSYLLKGVMSLRLVPLKNGLGRIPACEVMLLTPTISRLIRENNIVDMPKFIEEGALSGMQTFNQSLVKMVADEKVSREIAEEFSDNKDEFVVALRKIKKL